ncbi:MAG: hypothetical protein AB8H12_23815 [Lewinella sp.]
MKHRLELQIHKALDVETMYKAFLHPLSERLGGFGSAFFIIPIYSYNPNEKNALRVIDIGGERAHLKFFRVLINVTSLDESIRIIKLYLHEKDLLQFSRLKFERENYNLLPPSI